MKLGGSGKSKLNAHVCILHWLLTHDDPRLTRHVEHGYRSRQGIYSSKHFSGTSRQRYEAFADGCESISHVIQGEQEETTQVEQEEDQTT